MNQQKSKATAATKAKAPSAPRDFYSFLKTDRRTLFFISALVAICMILYANTCYNEYALDDTMMITENRITQKGFDGIGDHLSHSFLYGYFKSEGQNTASSRWRPLALITYSIEIGIWGTNHPGMSHLINLFLYAWLVILVFLLLKNYLLKNEWLSFFVALLFAIHPVHTEVVANIKGRDEILSMLFILFSLMQLWKFLEEKNGLHYGLSLIFFFISLMAKENAVTFIAGIPVMLYFFSALQPKEIAKYASGFLGTVVFFFIIRNAIVPFSNLKESQELMNNPFLLASGMEALATKIYILLLYLKLLVWPSVLSMDYSYNQISYVNAANPLVWLSLLIYGGLFVFALTGIKKKNLLSFCILMFFITFSVSTNFFFGIGGLMGERLLFLPSVFAVMFIVIVANQLLNLLTSGNETGKRIAIAVIMTPLLSAASTKTMSRNTEWKNDVTLNLADVLKCPNSAKLNHGAGSVCITLAAEPGISSEKKDSLLNASLLYFEKTLSIYPGYHEAWLSKGITYAYKDSLLVAEVCWNKYREKYPNNAKLFECDQYLANYYYSQARIFLADSLMDSAVVSLQKTVSYAHKNDSVKFGGLYDLGGMYFQRGNYQQAYETLGKLMQVNPNYGNVAAGYAASKQMLGIKP